MNKPKINPRWICMLLKIKQACMEDNDLSAKVCGSGKFVVARYMDDMIACVMELETACEEYFDAMERNVNKCEAYYELLESFTPDMLNDAQIAEVKALVKKWKESDEEE